MAEPSARSNDELRKLTQGNVEKKVPENRHLDLRRAANPDYQAPVASQPLSEGCLPDRASSKPGGRSSFQ